ncbi:MAG: hypothetical protein HXS41_00770 [Theionarchaea archaeon]|nr:hypothetical protein [Theionarchaea archaeon]MBU6999315.1 hypothetical protein [Theionarchaea archaeon]MBU7019560.1 hypothetical protein [Theionarchaea archaeon]MBU7033738.1 hypothetical protein [Theionarchaea archaeon]MBU7039452.1 hypothetical protein [Theionarchaea archaeon]
MDLCSAYQAMPQKDCGICGYQSCSTFLRNVIFNREPLEKCHWLKSGYSLDIASMQTLIQTIQPLPTKVKPTSLIEPCSTESGMVMAELYLAHREVEYGWLDPLVCDILPAWTEPVRCSKQLGIARIDFQQKEILLSVSGKTIIRHAESEEDITRTRELLSRIVEGAVICTCLSTRMECISEASSCQDSNPPAVTSEEKSCLDHLNLAGHICSFWDQPSHDFGSFSLKKQAMNFIVSHKGGLVLLSLAQHLSLLEAAVKDLCEHTSLREVSLKKEIADFIATALTRNADAAYHDLCSFLLQEQPSFYRELYSVIFRIQKISTLRERCRG